MYINILLYLGIISASFSRSEEGWTSIENSELTPVRFDALSKLIGVHAKVSIVYLFFPLSET